LWQAFRKTYFTRPRAFQEVQVYMSQVKIMLVEDERPIAENIIYALEAENFIVRWYSKGGDAVANLETEQADFHILDINLPDMTGFDVCRAIRKLNDKPVLFLSARQEEVDRIVALEMGGDDFLMKPFSLRELTARIRAILRRSTNSELNKEPAAARVPITVDEKRSRIEYFGQKVELSKYEYFILRTLAKRPGWVFSRDQLIDHAMGQMSAPFDRTIDAHIKSIRAKLRKIKPDIEAIETQRGFGYALRENW
jgi:two-component system, OmpR family, catabolic regulation response regulator CreB